MQKPTAECLFNVKNALGEGPLWHPQESCLYWVDIINEKLFRSNQDLTTYHTTHFDFSVSAFGFLKNTGLVLATSEGFCIWKEQQNILETVWNPLPDRPGVRMNDGKVDPAGRFWAGSIDSENGEGELYRLDPDGSQHVILKNIGISNGLDWSPDRKTMYYTDSHQYTIFAFDYDLDSGDISACRTFVELPRTKHEIVQDGLCVDAEGYVWSAQWNGWQVVRYDPAGTLIQSIQLPVQRVTSCCFAGEKLDQLIITTARAGLSESALASQPQAGNIFIYQTNTQGQITNYFG